MLIFSGICPILILQGCKITPIINELNKQRVDNIRILLNKTNKFHIIEDGLDEETKRKLAELIPNEQKITSKSPEPMPIEETKVSVQPKLAELIPNEQKITSKSPEPMPIKETKVSLQPEFSKLTLPYPLPENNEHGYDRTVTPEFWKQLFDSKDELMNLRELFMKMYDSDKYIDNTEKRFKICDLLEKLFPGYLTKYTLSHGETPKTLVTVNVLNCLITLLYGIITSKLFDKKEEYLLLFKGGRALQLSLNDIPNVTKYFSEDTDVLIIPNKTQGGIYDFDKMKNLSCHIAYLVKWIIPEEVNIVITLPTEDAGKSKDITKILYNDKKLYKALSDIGFGEMKEDIKNYFETPLYYNFYLDEFKTNSLFITPTLDNILDEKLYFYAKYSNFKNKIENGDLIFERGYEGLTKEECDFYMFKFNRAIKQLVNSIIKRDYLVLNNEETFEVKLPEMIDWKQYPLKEREKLRNNINKQINDISRMILSSIIIKFNDYSISEKDRIITELYPLNS